MIAAPAPDPAGGDAAPARAGIVERALANLRSAWRGIAGGDGAADPAGPGQRDKLARHIRECLDGSGGEVSARSRMAALGHRYLSLSAAARETFLRVLAEDFGPKRPALDAAATFLLAAASPGDRAAAERALVAALDSPRRRLLTRFNALPHGVKFLVDLRAVLIDLAARDDAFQPALDDLTQILRSWFDIGFLDLRRITWQTPAALLEKLIAYEAVHEITSWDDLKNRLDSDRRCFAFFHPRMADEPLIFVEVALTAGIASSIQALLDEKAPVQDPAGADTAVFYSISNAQKGLAGISFGNVLIKQVVERLAAEFPRLKNFVTLSPMPGFVAWLKAQPAEGVLTGAERRALPKRGAGEQHPLALIRNPDWHRNAYLEKALKAPLLRAAARYLAAERRPGGGALDPVAHFHLSNGARIDRIGWLSDVSAKGLAQSAGLMVNYLYRMADIDANREAYSGKGQVQVSASVRALAKG